MRVGLNLWTAPSAWWPPGASFGADFTANRYMRDGLPAEASATYSLARSSSKYAADADSNFVFFDTDIPARTALGLSVEPATTNLLTDPVGLDSWLTTLASATPQAGPVLGIFVQPSLVTDTGAHVVARLRHPGNQSITDGVPVALSFWFRQASSERAVLFVNGNGGSSQLVISPASGEVLSIATTRGPMGLVELVQHVPGTFCARATWVPNFSGPCEVAIGPGTGVPGDTIIALGAFMEPGSLFTSPVIGFGAPSSRAADSLTLHLPAGLHHLTFTFADLTTQVISAVSGDYVVPTDLNRAVIRTIVGVAG